MDAILSRLIDESHAYAPEYRDGLSDHQPMALVALARLDGVAALPVGTLERWAHQYRTRLEPAPFADRQGFARRIRDGDPHAVARAALERLGEGMPGTAGHGLLRTYFALEAEPLLAPAVFAAELARGLDYFADGAVVLSGAQRGGGATLLDALSGARLDPAERERFVALNMITSRQEAVARTAAFASIVGAVRDDFSFAESLAALAAIGARTTDFTLLHALTTGQAILALERLLPGLDSGPLRRGWIAFVAAAWLVQDLQLATAGDPPTDLVPSWTRLGQTHDDHAPKAAFALDRLHAEFGLPVFHTALAAYVEAYA